MDFEPRFDCCEACNSISYQCQNNKSPIQIQGQGDYKCNIELQGNENVWMNLDKGKKLRSKFVRELNDPGSKAEQQKFLDGHCFCFSKQDFPDKLKREKIKPENKNHGLFENSDYFWDSSNANWSFKPERLLVSEGSKRDHYSNADKLMGENIFEFEEKVDFLFRIFKDYGQKFPTEGYIEQMKSTDGMFKDVAHLFDFNKRLCAAEEGIEKLALILEDLVKDTSKKKTNEGTTFGDHLDFDEMSVPQRINYLKSRNDLMLSFMKAFLKVGSSEETFLRAGSTSSEYELRQMPLNAKENQGENHQAKDLNRVRIMDTLRKLRMRMTELRQKKIEPCNEQHRIRNEKKGETSAKYAKNKLEVISEQAELALSDESENAGNNFRGKNAARNLNDKLSEINEGSDESDFSVPDVTFRILSEESDFFKPLDKMFSNSKEKKFGKGSTTQILKDKTDEGDIATNYDSSSEISCIYYDDDNLGKITESSKTTLPGLFTKKDLKETLKREKNPLEKASKDLCKESGGSGKKSKDYAEDKIQSARKLLQKNSHVVFQRKGSRNGCSLSEICSSSREDRKKEARGTKEQRQRPMTEPSSHRKTSPSSSLKPLIQDKYAAKISGINNVKSKNKILLSKKSCVQTS